MSTRREFLAQIAVPTLIAGAALRVTSVNADEKNVSSSISAKAGSMKPYKVPHTDLTVSRLAYGCAMLGLDWSSPDFVAKIIPNIHTALEQGINFFDTAGAHPELGREQLEALKHQVS